MGTITLKSTEMESKFELGQKMIDSLTKEKIEPGYVWWWQNAVLTTRVFGVCVVSPKLYLVNAVLLHMLLLAYEIL